ncbi:shikimate kinase [Candidatus Vallotia cooleyia]|uniref:shikimate kinase n=1 Tax=Candidatus Vallotiella adelgis TaxID=1177211 RepID=UPI001D019428|nr:shikimate kinase [Candidatus Vallotia cooleyia]UDG82269.1 Shikimate kinase 1 [Candidatus Vallotia cooleyia]
MENARIFFIGLMGAGKTTVGRTIARRLGRPFVDSDHEIESRTGVQIPMIFAHEGEDGFRHRESAIIDELTCLPDLVLATGGGAVMWPENREWLHTRGIVIYLHATPYDLWLRTRHDKNRPLLQVDNALDKLESLFKLRDPLYRACAHFVIETGQSTVSGLINIVLAQLEPINIRLQLDSDPSQDTLSPSP